MANGRITGTVKDPNDIARAGVVVKANYAGGLAGQDTTGADGAFDIPDLETGKKYDLTVIDGGKRVYSEQVEIPAGGTATRTIKYDPAAGPAEPDPGAIGDLMKTANDPAFARNARVSISEARHFQHLYMVANYFLARVVASIENLSDAEQRVAMDAVNWEAWWASRSGEVLDLQQEFAKEPLTQQRLMQQVRAAYDLGDETADRVNVEFKTVFREFVALCADDLLAVDITKAEAQGAWEESKTQEVVSHYRRVKQAMIRLTEEMSRIGRPDMKDHVDKWVPLLDKSLQVLNGAALNAAGDIDAKHVWGFVSNLNGVNKSEIDAYIEHAPKGTQLMGYVLDIYERFGQFPDSMQDMTKEHLRSLFHGDADAKNGGVDWRITVPNGNGGQATPPAKLLHETASVLNEFWPANWR